MLNQIMRPIARNLLKRGSQVRLGHGHAPTNPAGRPVTFEEACVPQGSFQEHFNKRQAKYNAQLIVGVASLVLTIAAVGQFELLYFNYVPPKPRDQN